MQSVISSNNYLNTRSISRILPIIFDLFLIADIFISTYLLLFSPDRTYKLGIWLILALQILFFPIFILLAHLNTRNFRLKRIELINQKTFSEKKHPLAYTISDNETEIVAPPFEKRLNIVRTLIYFGFALDVVVAINFMVLGALINDGGGDGSIATYSILFDQVYFLPPVLMLIFYYFHLQGQRITLKDSNMEIIIGEEIAVTTRKTFFANLKIRKTLRLIATVSFILLLVFFAIFAYAKQVEDNNINSFNLENSGPYHSIQIYGMYDTGNKIDVITHGLQQHGGAVSNHLVKYSIDTENNKIIGFQEFLNIPIGFREVVDSVVFDKEMYLLLLDDNENWAFSVFKYTFESEVMELIYTWDLGLTGAEFRGSRFVEYLVTIEPFVYILSAFEDGVHLIQTPVPFFFRPHYSTITTIDSNGITQQSLNLTILDAVTHNDQTSFIHISETGFDKFELTTYDGTGGNFSEGSKISKSLSATFSEDIYGIPTPNSASLFVANDALYYRSTQNLLNIDTMESSEELPNINNEDFNIYSRGLRGAAYQNNLLYLNTETKIQYTLETDLMESEKAIAVNSHYSSSIFSNIFISDDILVTASNDGRVFTWEVESELVAQDKENFSQLILLGIIVYITSSSIYFIVRRKI